MPLVIAIYLPSTSIPDPVRLKPKSKIIFIKSIAFVLFIEAANRNNVFTADCLTEIQEPFLGASWASVPFLESAEFISSRYRGKRRRTRALFDWPNEVCDVVRGCIHHLGALDD